MCLIGERELRPAQTALDSTPPERSLSSMDATAIRRAYEWPPSRRSVRRAGSLSGTGLDPVRPPSGFVRGAASGGVGFASGRPARRPAPPGRRPGGVVGRPSGTPSGVRRRATGSGAVGLAQGFRLVCRHTSSRLRGKHRRTPPAIDARPLGYVVNIARSSADSSRDAESRSVRCAPQLILLFTRTGRAAAPAPTLREFSCERSG